MFHDSSRSTHCLLLATLFFIGLIAGCGPTANEMPPLKKWRKADTDGDKRISRKEIDAYNEKTQSHLRLRFFDRYDLNDDGFYDKNDIAAAPELQDTVLGKIAVFIGVVMFIAALPIAFVHYILGASLGDVLEFLRDLLPTTESESPATGAAEKARLQMITFGELSSAQRDELP